MSRRFKFHFYLLLSLTFQFRILLTSSHGEVIVGSSRQSFFKLLRDLFSSCSCVFFEQNSMIHPVGDCPFTAISYTFSKFGASLHSEDLKSLLNLNPIHRAEILNQCEITLARNPLRGNAFLLTDFCSEILESIYEYLDFEDILTMRLVSRYLLIHHIHISRSKLFTQLHPRITDGYERLYESTVSAAFLNHLSKPLSDLLSRETRVLNVFLPCPKIGGSPSTNLAEELGEIEADLDKTNRLDDLLTLSLHFYRRTDSLAYFSLVETILKSKMYDTEELVRSLQVDMNYAFNFACKWKFLCLGKSILQISDVDHYLGAQTCLNSNNLVLFESILRFISSSPARHFDVGRAKFLFVKSITVGNIDFVRLIIKFFPQLAIEPSSAIFVAILSRNPTILEEIIKFRGIQDFKLKSSDDRLTPFQSAAKCDFPQGIAIICRHERKSRRSRKLPYFLRESSSLRVAIYFKANQALKVIIEEIRKYNYLDFVFSIHELVKLILPTISSRNKEAMGLLLDNIFLKSNSYFQIPDEYYNPINYAVQLNFMEGFDLLIEHFGVNILEILDHQGRNVFLVAVFLKKFDLAFKIASLNPNLIVTFDKNGNTALHYALVQHQPFDIIMKLAALKIPWNLPNSNNITPMDFLLREIDFWSLEQVQEIFKLILL